MVSIRQCSRSGCSQAAVATLTYVYADSTAVLGPLAIHAEPHSYDLCADHSERLTAPRGWEVLRLEIPSEPAPPQGDDLLALVDAVRQAAQGTPTSAQRAGGDPGASEPPSGRPSDTAQGKTRLAPPGADPKRSHLRIIH